MKKPELCVLLILFYFPLFVVGQEKTKTVLPSKSTAATYIKTNVNLGDGILVPDSNCYRWDFQVYITDTTPINKRFGVDECYDGLTKAFIINLCKRKLNAYTNNEHSTTIMDQDLLSERLNPTTDIDWVVDPVTGRRPPHALLYNCRLINTINEYQVEGKWQFDKATGKAQVIPLSIAPIGEQYFDDGKKWAYSPFVTTYHDAKPTIEEYEQLHPNISFLQSFCNTLCETPAFDPLSDTQSVITKRISRQLPLPDTIAQNRQNDNLLYSLISKNALSRSVTVYVDSLLNDTLGTDLRQNIPVAYKTPKYRVLEDWTVDKKNSIISVQVVALAPVVDNKNLFWIKFKDVKRITETYRQAHPTVGLNDNLWRAYLAPDGH